MPDFCVEVDGYSVDVEIEAPSIDVDTSGPTVVLEVTPGSPGANGDSAYQVAVKAGFIGTEADWIESLKGAPGGAFNGTAWWYGQGAPTTVIGSSPGDYYIDTITGTVYELGD